MLCPQILAFIHTVKTCIKEEPALSLQIGTYILMWGAKLDQLCLDGYHQSVPPGYAMFLTDVSTT